MISDNVPNFSLLLLHLLTSLEEQERIFEAEWEAEQAAKKEEEEREAAEAAENEAMENGEIAVIKINMDNDIADPLQTKVPLDSDETKSIDSGTATPTEPI